MKKVVFLVLTVILAGCATTGNTRLAEENQATVAQKIKKGKTRKDEVRAAMGDPGEVTFTDSGNEIWKYHYSRSTSKATNFIPYVNLLSQGADVDSKTLIVMFDKRGVVSQYTLSNSKSEERVGIMP